MTLPPIAPRHARNAVSQNPCAFGSGKQVCTRAVALRLTPMAAAVATLAMASTFAALPVQARTAGAWFASSAGADHARATHRMVKPILPASTARQQQQARATLQRSVNNLGHTAAALAQAQAAQQAAREAGNVDRVVPDGHAEGGLWDRKADGTLHAWSGAARPVAAVKDGKTTVTIGQTASRAVLDWETFNVGANTTVAFQQRSGDAVLNRVMGADTRPSQIQGAIRGDGTVMVANQNGVVFSGTSQVNVRNLVAAAAHITPAQFETYGIYGESGITASFTDAGGKVEVQAGAQLRTLSPGSVTQGGGYVLLLGREASNAGEIATPRGQALLAAGDAFVIRKGYGTDANRSSTTRGNEAVALRVDGVDEHGNAVPRTAGLARNTGLIVAREGDITLTGHEVRQDGVAIATTSINTRGTVHLLNSASDAQGRVTLGANAVTAVLLQDDGQTALDSQRGTLIDESAVLDIERVTTTTVPFDNLSTLPDRRDQSRIEIVSGQHVDFAPGSMTLATGGQVAVSARGRAQVQAGATLDVSGAVGVQVAMESNNIAIDIQGNEQRDAPLNRESGRLNNLDVWVDRRGLVYVPQGADGYESDRWYTAGGLLEVGGYLGNQPHTVGERAAQGGTVTLGGSEVVTQRGSMVNLSGGTLDVQSGYINQSWMRGADGRLYELSRAPADMLYEGLYQGYELTSPRWNQTLAWRSPLIGPQRRWEPGYTVGRNAGRLVISAPGIIDSSAPAAPVTAVLEGDIDASVYQGARQQDAVQEGLDGYLQSQMAVARHGGLAVASRQYTSTDAPLVDWESTLNIVLGSNSPGAPASFEEAFDSAFAGTVYLDAARLNDASLGSLTLRAAESASLEAPLELAPGGRLAVYAADIAVSADVTARGGAILLTNVRDGGANVLQPAEGRASVIVQPHVTLDTRGLWTNHRLDAEIEPWRRAYIDGGPVTLRSSGDVTLARDARIDASAGGVVLADGGKRGGAGGDIALVASNASYPAGDRGNHGDLTLDGTVISRGYSRGGRLTLQTGGVLAIGGQVGGIGDTLSAGTPAPYELTLSADTVVPTGTPLPVDVNVRVDTVPPGGTLPVGYWSFSGYGVRDYKDFNGDGDTNDYLVTQAEWLNVPVQADIIDADGMSRTVLQGDRIPAGSRITSFFYGHIEQYSIAFPAEVFPQGVPIMQGGGYAESYWTVPFALAAGSRAAMDVTLVAGTVLPQGVTAALDIPVAPIRSDSVDVLLVQSGFSAYSLNGQSALIVTADARIRPVMPVYRFNIASDRLPTDADPALATDFVLDPVYVDNPGLGILTQRGGTDLALHSAGDPDSTGLARSGMVVIEPGARVEVDPNSRVDIASGGQITVHGSIVAPGGDITLINPVERPGLGSAAGGMHPGGLSIWIGERAVLDAAGRAHVALDRHGRRYGVASGGGRITLGSEGGLYVSALERDTPPPGNELSSHAYIVLRPGSVLDVSGAAAAIDLPTARGLRYAGEPVAIHGDGGAITLRSYSGIYAHGTLRAHGGSAAASGGELLLSLESPIVPVNSQTGGIDTPEFMRLRVGRVLTVGQQSGGPVPGAGAIAGQEDAGLVLGHGGIGTDQIAAGGFGTLKLRARDAIVFDGDVQLSMGRSLTLKAGQYANLAAGTVTLAAPHVALQGQTLVTETFTTTLPDIMPHYTLDGTATGAPNGAVFSVNGGLIDISNAVQIGYADTTIASSGDLRLLTGGTATQYDPANGQNPYSLIVTPTFLTAVGNLTLAGARIYPASNAEVTVQAGYSAGQNHARQANSPNTVQLTDAVLTLARPAGAGESPAAPYSAYGDITLRAGEIRQGGALYAPFGAIDLQAARKTAGAAAEVHFLPGSITSASGAGLVMPYGGTTDGVSWMVDGAAPADVDLISGSMAKGAVGNYATQGLTVTATHIRSDADAIVDLSGGGTLTGAAFVSGRGGSVDTLLNPLQAGGKVYAIVPGVQTAAPVAGGSASAWTGDVPIIGQQITLPGGVPGLPAGTYTLMPANYALLPGAYRVELGGTMAAPASRALALRNGTYLAGGYQGVAGTAMRDALPTRVTIMPGATVRRYSQYNETSYTGFQLSRADTLKTRRPALEADGKRLVFTFSALDTALADAAQIQAPALDWNGSTRLTADEGGYGGWLALKVGSPAWDQYQSLVVTSDNGSARTRSLTQTVLAASDINAIGAPTVFIGGEPAVASADPLQVIFNTAETAAVILEKGATLHGGQIFLAARQGGSIQLESGSRIDTRGFAEVALLDSSPGYYFGGGMPMVVASNGEIDLALNGLQFAAGTIRVGDGAAIHSRGGISFLSRDGVSFDGAINLAALSLDIAAASVNLGSANDLAAARDASVLPAGFNLDQDLVRRLVAGDPAARLSGVRNLKLTTNSSFNVYGSVNLDLRDGEGQSLLDTLTFTTPAIYGAGGSGDRARLAMDTFLWNTPQRVVSTTGDDRQVFDSALPGATIAGGPGEGRGSLEIDARTITLGHLDRTTGGQTVTFDHLLLGFSDVTLRASRQIGTQDKNTLSLWQSGPDPSTAFDPATYAGTGGSLTLATPLLTTSAGGEAAYRAGGALAVRMPDGGAPAGLADPADALGGRIEFASGEDLLLDTAIVLPSGRLTATAGGNLLLGAHSRLDVSGRPIAFFDVTRHSWGGDVVLESTRGNIVQEAGSVIDVSAANNAAGMLALTATGDSAGRVELNGTLRGAGATSRDSGAFDVRAQLLSESASDLTANFASLNTALNEGGFAGARSFGIKQGSLTIGDELRAHDISVSIDGGSLTVAGAIDASGAAPGTIRLAARDDLMLAGTALLDVHGRELQVDSYGQAIEAKNRGHVELASRDGWLRLREGAAIDLSSPDGEARGQVQLQAGRTGATSGDARIEAGGRLDIGGARGVFLNAMQRYELPGGSVIDQALLNGYDADSADFIEAAYDGNVAAGMLSATLRGKLDGLTAYGDAFHLRPGVEISSLGDLTTSGDIDLAGYRYGPEADRGPAAATYGAGEAMSLVLRAGGNLHIAGSISDGFKSVDGIPPVTDIIEDVASDTAYFSDYIRLGVTYRRILRAGLTFTVARDWVVPTDWGLNSALLYPVGPNNRTILPGQTITAGTVLSRVLVPQGKEGDVANLFVITVSPGEPAYAGTSVMAAMLAPGMQSAWLRLVAGADADAASSRALRAASMLGEGGNLVLNNPLLGTGNIPVPSVVRTGTGSLDLLAGGDVDQQSLYGIYTSGTDTGAAGLPAGAYLSNHGGDVALVAQGDVSGYTYDRTSSNVNFQSATHWLVRGGSDGATYWAIRFGGTLSLNATSSALAGFTGIGTLGGGNVTLVAGGNAGTMTSTRGNAGVSEYESLMLVVAAGGQVTSVSRDQGIVTGGTLTQTGGGDLKVKVGGAFNKGDNRGNLETQAAAGSASLMVNMRGDIDVTAGSIGAVQPVYTGVHAADPRGLDRDSASSADVAGGISVMLGDSAATVRTAGDLVLNHVSDPGQITLPGSTSYFALWQPRRTSLALFAAGGHLVPHTGSGLADEAWRGVQMLPARFAAVASGGSIYYGSYRDAVGMIELAPSPTGGLELLARESIYGAGMAWGTTYGQGGTLRFGISGAGAGPNDIPNPFRPVTTGNYRNFFHFQTDTPVRHEHAGDQEPIRIYAVHGDIQSVALGETMETYDNVTQSEVTHYIAAKSARVLAGRDIVNFGKGTQTGNADASPSLIMNANANDVSVIRAGRDIFHLNVEVAGPGTLDVTAAGSLYQGNQGAITSIGPVVPGDTRLGASIAVTAGAGAAGLDYAAFAALYLNAANQADTRPGYPLADQPGKVAHAYGEELRRWLGERYADDTGMRFGDDGTPVVFDAATMDALAFFQRLAPEQQHVFARQVYFAELRAGGREYNDVNGARYGSYLRGRQAIAALFPDARTVVNEAGAPVLDAAGNPLMQPIARGGSLTMFGGSGIRTLYGGDIHTLVPAGQTLIGVQGLVPPASAGVVTQGQGEIGLYSRGSILLGLSRIMTTFGGGITAWSAEGDINAGRGAMTTVVYTPPRRLSDDVGNVTLSPDVPSTGAGIATLNPIPEVPPGDVDLIAPLGTIDAGEAGIRVSGNVNLAALQVVNAANIQVQGDAVGIPAITSVNVGALTSASTAATTAANAAQDAVQRARVQQQQNLPSIISVQILGFGDGGAAAGARDQGPAGSGGAGGQPAGYQPDHMVQVVGRGDLSSSQTERLSERERGKLGL